MLMEYTYHRFPSFTERNTSICDSRIYRIDSGVDSTRFYFSGGYFEAENGQVNGGNEGYVELQNCSSDEFTCVLFRRKASNRGALLAGVPISLAELNHLLQERKVWLEPYLELYDFNYLYWRGSLLPNTSEELSDRVDIEIEGQYTIKFVRFEDSK
jgi:hypothetical protein